MAKFLALEEAQIVKIINCKFCTLKEALEISFTE
jgi:hypothetical protein